MILELLISASVLLLSIGPLIDPIICWWAGEISILTVLKFYGILAIIAYGLIAFCIGVEFLRKYLIKRGVID